MARDDRFYAFIVATTSRSRSRIHRFSLHRRWIKLSILVVFVALSVVAYGLYGVTQQARHTRIESENSSLREENQRQREELRSLSQRVDAVEDASRRLADISGIGQLSGKAQYGTGGPAMPIGTVSLNELEFKTNTLEQNLRTFENALRHIVTVPSIWPVEGKLDSGFGGRRNPFGGPGYEFHYGQDIETSTGTPVRCAAEGTVVFAGWQNGYGQVVIVDHGEGVTTRYGHLSKIGANVGQRLNRGELLGEVGSTGRSTGPHLHYEVRINDTPVDPVTYLPGLSN